MGGYCPFVGETPFEFELAPLPAPFVPLGVTEFPLEPIPFVDEARNVDPTEKEDCGKLFPRSTDEPFVVRRSHVN